MHIGRFDHAGVIEDAQQAGGADGLPPVGRVEGLGGHAATPRASSRSDNSVTNRAGGAQLNTPARMAVQHRGIGPAHSAQEQIQHAAQMSCRIVIRLPPAQEPVQDNAVQQRLQRVVRVQHRLGHPLLRVVGGRQRSVRLAEPVGLVVNDQKALPRVVGILSTASTEPLR